MSLSRTADGIFWFGVVGAWAAAAKHTFAPRGAFEELSPVAIRSDKEIEPGALWWGSYAFGAVNVGFGVIGLYAAYLQSIDAKRAYLLGTAVMFEAFSCAWWLRGPITKITNHKKQAIKIALFGMLFGIGFGLPDAPAAYH